jgi:molecular chaperone DnaK (HSP70)
MKKETKCMKKNQQRIIRLEFKSVMTPTVGFLEKNLLSLKDTKVQVEYPEQEKGIVKSAYSGLPLWEVFMLILTVSANLSTIASLLFQILHDKKNKANSVVFRLDKKKLEISGNFSKNEIEIILNEFAKVVKDDKEIKLLDEARRRELEDELSRLREVLPTYKELIKPQGWKKSKEAITKLEYYQSKQKEIEERISKLQKLLSSNGNT